MEHETTLIGNSHEGYRFHPRTGNPKYTTFRDLLQRSSHDLLKPHRKISILTALLEGCSVRSTSRMAGSHIETILKLLVEVGGNCERMLDENMLGISYEAQECDELWSYIQKKERRVTNEERANNLPYGDCYIHIGLDLSNKAVVSYTLGKRDVDTTWKFIHDLRQRVVDSPQISTDGFSSYVAAVNHAFGQGAHYAQVVKIFASEPSGCGRYKPS